MVDLYFIILGWFDFLDNIKCILNDVLSFFFCFNELSGCFFLGMKWG